MMSVVILSFVEIKILVNLLRMVSGELVLKCKVEFVIYDSWVILIVIVVCEFGGWCMCCYVFIVVKLIVMKIKIFCLCWEDFDFFILIGKGVFGEVRIFNFCGK